jgi:hypothetical protein
MPPSRLTPLRCVRDSDNISWFVVYDGGGERGFVRRREEAAAPGTPGTCVASNNPVLGPDGQPIVSKSQSGTGQSCNQKGG